MGKHIRFDWAMKRLLRQKANFVVLEGFLSELLKEDITISEILESESNQQHERDKYNVVDILVKNTPGELMLIEVQNTREVDFFHRMNYGQAKLTVEHISLGTGYDNIKKVFSINIVYFDLGQGEDYVYKGTTEFIGLHKKDVLGLSQSQKETYPIENVSDIFTTYYLLKVNAFDDNAKDTLDEWIYFLKNSEIKDEFNAKGLKEAKEVMRVDDMTKAEKLDYERFVKYHRIRHGEIFTAKLDGRKEGRDEIEKELLPKLEASKQREEEAKQREEEAKLREGLAIDSIRKTILNLKKTGMELKQISEIVSMTIEEIEQILNQ